MKLKTGCCGLPAEEQEYYEKFKVLEVQQSLYRPEAAEDAHDWRMSAPDDFEFTLQAHQAIAHGLFEATDKVLEAWAKTEQIASALKARNIIFQSPVSFTPTSANKNNIKKFFKTVAGKQYSFIWEPQESWTDEEIGDICGDSGLVHCVDPFKRKSMSGPIRYFHLNGIGGYKHRYRGWDLKKLQDFCEQESEHMGNAYIYVIFNNAYMAEDASRFQWITKHTKRAKDINLDFLKKLCREIDAEKEEEKVQLLSREAERIVSLILHTDYAKVDIEIEKSKLRELCKKLFPDKGHLYEMVYARRFDRLWEQFREQAGEERR